MVRRASWLLLAVACGPAEAPQATGPTEAPSMTADSAGSPTPDGDESADTGASTGSAPTATATCAVGDNALRVTCSLTLATADTAELVLTARDGTERRFPSAEVGTEHLRTAWGLRPDTVYTWAFGPASGTVTTGTLPPDLARASVVTTGTTDAFDAVLQPLMCDDATYMTLLDPSGHVVWYQATERYTTGMHAYDVDDAAGSVLVADAVTFEEIGFDGTPGQVLVQGTDFDEDLHHDVERWNGYTYLLFHESVDGALVDGVHVFDGPTRRGTFRLSDHFEIEGAGGPGPNPIGNDWSHGNGIEATADGRIVLSLLKFSTVVVFDGDPASPTFLALDQVLSGTAGGGLPGADAVPAEGPLEGFQAQHNASLVDDALYLFDNTGVDGRSRAARYRIGAGTLTLDAEWRFDDRCVIQGGAIAVGDGVLGTCATAHDVRWFPEGEAVAAWTLEATCSTLGPVALNRAIPVAFD